MSRTFNLIEGRVFATNGYPEMIFDKAGNHILDVRSHGRLQYAENGDELELQLSTFIQDAINEKMARMGIETLKTY